MSVIEKKEPAVIDYQKIAQKKDKTLFFVIPALILILAVTIGGAVYLMPRLKEAVKEQLPVAVPAPLDIVSDKNEEKLAEIDNLIGEKNFSQALAVILQLESEQIKIDELNGLIARQMNNGYKSEAVETAKKLVELRGDYHSYNYLGFVYSEIGDYANAEIYLLKSIADNSNYRPAHNNLGNVYNNLKKIDLAEAEYLKAIKLEPENPKSYYNVAIIYQNSNRIDKAIEYYLKSLELNKTMPALEPNIYEDNLYFLAYQYYLKGDYENCRNYISLYLEKQPNGREAKEILNACK